MKTRIFVTVLVVFCLTSVSIGSVVASPSLAGGDFVWAKSMGGISSDFSNDITLDSIGNVYTTGSFSGTTDFDPGLGVSNLTSAGGGDIFVSKLDSNGNFVWAKSMGGTIDEVGFSIATDVSGNVYTTGYFFGTTDFDPGSGTYNLTSNGEIDIFVSKLDSSGNFVWAKSIGGTNTELGSGGIALDSGGNVYTTGYFTGTTDFDPGVGVFSLTSAGGFEIFVSKLDSNGNFVWAKSMSGTTDEVGFGIATDSSGNVYTTGHIDGIGTTDFDPGVGVFNLTGGGMFVSKLDSSGNFVWAKSVGSASQPYGLSIAVDSSFNVYTTGFYGGPVDFDPGVGEFNLSPEGFTDIFVSKLDSTGNFVWAKSMGGTDRDVCRDIAVDITGNVYTTGYYNGTADFDPGLGVFNLISTGGRDIFVSKLAHEAVIQYVTIDIKPGSDPNPINLGSKGVVPVAAMTTGEFDAGDLDPGTVLFAGASPLRWAYQDVDWDGDMDLLLHFETQSLKLNKNSSEASLSGKTFDGMSVEGMDKVNIVPAP